MKQTMKYLSIAALVAVGAIMMGCNKLDIVTEQTQQEEEPVISNTVTLTTTVSLDAATKALTADGEKTFAEGEQIALVYKKTGGATAVAVSDALKDDGDIASGAKSATFTFTLDDPDKDQNVTYVYPAAMAKADGTINYDALASQDGKLTTLSSSLDLATYSAAWNGTALPNVTLDNQLAILALTLKNYTGSSDLTSTITGVTITDGTNTYAITRSAAAGPIYVAIQPTTSADIEVTATDGTKNYTKSLTGKTYEAGNGYSISWRMDPVETTVTWTASDMEYLILDEGVTSGNSINGITVTGSNLFMNSWKGTYIEAMDGNVTFTFTSSVGNIKSIVITAEDITMDEWSVPSGWTVNMSSSPMTLTWSGTPSATVSLPLEECQQNISDISTIEFTVWQ